MMALMIGKTVLLQVLIHQIIESVTKWSKDELSVRIVNLYVRFINTGNLELSGGRQCAVLALCPGETHARKTGTDV
jgi:hypothetical protein